MINILKSIEPAIKYPNKEITEKDLKRLHSLANTGSCTASCCDCSNLDNNFDTWMLEDGQQFDRKWYERPCKLTGLEPQELYYKEEVKLTAKEMIKKVIFNNP